MVPCKLQVILHFDTKKTAHVIAQLYAVVYLTNYWSVLTSEYVVTLTFDLGVMSRYERHATNVTKIKSEVLLHSKVSTITTFAMTTRLVHFGVFSQDVKFKTSAFSPPKGTTLGRTT